MNGVIFIGLFSLSLICVWVFIEREYHFSDTVFSPCTFIWMGFATLSQSNTATYGVDVSKKLTSSRKVFYDCNVNPHTNVLLCWENRYQHFDWIHWLLLHRLHSHYRGGDNAYDISIDSMVIRDIPLVYRNSSSCFRFLVFKLLQLVLLILQNRCIGQEMCKFNSFPLGLWTVPQFSLCNCMLGDFQIQYFPQYFSNQSCSSIGCTFCVSRTFHFREAE